MNTDAALKFSHYPIGTSVESLSWQQTVSNECFSGKIGDCLQMHSSNDKASEQANPGLLCACESICADMDRTSKVHSRIRKWWVFSESELWKWWWWWTLIRKSFKFPAKDTTMDNKTYQTPTPYYPELPPDLNKHLFHTIMTDALMSLPNNEGSEVVVAW